MTAAAPPSPRFSTREATPRSAPSPVREGLARRPAPMVLQPHSHEALFAAVRSGDAATIRALVADAEASGTSLAALAGEAATRVAADAESEEVVRLLLSLYDFKAGAVRTRGRDLDAFYLTAMQSHTGRAPYFGGTHYATWKHKMKMYLTAIHPSVWWIVEKGHTVKDVGSPSTKEQNQHKNAVAANAILGALSPEEYNKVYGLESAKEIWDTLQLAHEGTLRDREIKIELLMGKLERFIMEKDETPKGMYSRLILIVNEIKGLGSKEMTNSFVVERMLRAITPRNPILATIIREREDFSKLTPHDVLGTIHDSINQSSSSKKKYLAPKARKEAEESSSEEESEDEREYEMELFQKRLDDIFKVIGKSNERHSKTPRNESSETDPFMDSGPNKKNKDNDEKKNEHHNKKIRSKRQKKSQKGQAHIGEEWGSNDSGGDP